MTSSPRTVVLAVKVFLLGVLSWLLLYLGTSYTPELPGFRPPWPIIVIDLINLYIHEAGHLFFRIFPRFLEVLGGSLFQVLLPLLLAIVTFRQTPQHVVYPLFWVGESMVNVSPYIRDADQLKLTLIAKGLTHDWAYLLHGNLQMAAPLADAVLIVGITVCTAAIGAGTYYAVRVFREDEVPRALE
jgi:hypothetical protein